MKISFAILIARSLACMAIAGPAWAQNPLDDAIYSVKCLGADDKEACKAKARKDFEDYQRQKQVGGVAPGAGASPGPQGDPNNYQERCETVNASGPADVDTAYNRAMNAYHFMTIEERQLARPGLTGGFTHARVPGVRYDIATSVKALPNYEDAGRAHVTLALYKSERGSGTIMNATYCISTSNYKRNPHFHNKAFWNGVSAGFARLVE